MQSCLKRAMISEASLWPDLSHLSLETSTLGKVECTLKAVSQGIFSISLFFFQAFCS